MFSHGHRIREFLMDIWSLRFPACACCGLGGHSRFAIIEIYMNLNSAPSLSGLSRVSTLSLHNTI